MFEKFIKPEYQDIDRIVKKDKRLYLSGLATRKLKDAIKVNVFVDKDMNAIKILTGDFLKLIRAVTGRTSSIYFNCNLIKDGLYLPEKDYYILEKLI